VPRACIVTRATSSAALACGGSAAARAIKGAASSSLLQVWVAALQARFIGMLQMG
jgi:hypothetical protein